MRDKKVLEVDHKKASVQLTEEQSNAIRLKDLLAQTSESEVRVSADFAECRETLQEVRQELEKHKAQAFTLSDDLVEMTAARDQAKGLYERYVTQLTEANAQSMLARGRQAEAVRDLTEVTGERGMLQQERDAARTHNTELSKNLQQTKDMLLACQTKLQVDTAAQAEQLTKQRKRADVNEQKAKESEIYLTASVESVKVLELKLTAETANSESLTTQMKAVVTEVEKKTKQNGMLELQKEKIAKELQTAKDKLHNAQQFEAMLTEVRAELVQANEEHTPCAGNFLSAALSHSHTTVTPL
jgi:chromosome segregation ATPase